MQQLRTGQMTGKDFQTLLICAQADEAVERQRALERQRAGK